VVAELVDQIIDLQVQEVQLVDQVVVQTKVM
jgi:hypothetical protein